MLQRRVPLLVALVILVMGLTGPLLWQHAEARYRFHPVRDGVLYRARQPEGLAWQQLAPLQITKVVNLRPRDEDPEIFDEEVRQAAGQGGRMIHIPMDNNFPTQEQLERFLRVVLEPGGATLVHCAQGRQRTGSMVAAYRVIVQDWSPDDAIEELKEFLDSHEPVMYERRLAMLQDLRATRQQWLARLASPPMPGSTTSRPASAPATK
jgi:protein tyrosine/serine phosphatase